MNKICTKCGLEKSVNEFNIRNKNTGTLQSHCKPCLRDANKKWYIKNIEYAKSVSKKWESQNTEKKRNARIKYEYGITPEQYSEMLKSQNNMCAICNKSQTDFDTNLCIDHNHSTNKVRGLLCRPCNAALGLFNDSEITVENALKYLKIHLFE